MNSVAFNVCLLGAVVVGLISIVIGLVNRVHAYPLSHKVLHRLRQGHDIIIQGIPLAIFWFAGIQGPGLLRGGTWHSLSLGWQFLFGIGLAGSGLLVVRSVRRWLRRSSPAEILCESRVVNIEQQLGYRPVGHGPYEFMTRIPGNDVFQIEFSEKHFRLTGLPQAWDGLSILHLSDFHYIGTISRPFFERAIALCEELEPDLIVFTGDLLDNEELADWIPSTLGRLKAELGCYFILGNHDWYLRPEIGRQAMLDAGWIDVANRFVVQNHRGNSMLIAGTEFPWIGANPELSAAPETDFRLLLSHTPDNLPWARRQNFDLMLSGHNHGGQIRIPLIGPVYSPSKYGCYYADGVFWESPTLLHVSRGLAGRHPWRWRCLPEITKIVLQPQLLQAPEAAAAVVRLAHS